MVKTGIKICVIGCGAIANSMHGPAYLKYKAENPDAVFSACCDVDAAKAEAFKATFGFESAYSSMDVMLAEQKPDAVCLVSPVDLTAILAEKILDKGIPLLLEKPPGRTKEETLRLTEAAERKNVPNMVAFNRRYAPDLTADGKEPFEREGFYHENKLFFDSIMAGVKPPGDLRTALQSVEAADCIRNRRENLLPAR